MQLFIPPADVAKIVETLRAYAWNEIDASAMRRDIDAPEHCNAVRDELYSILAIADKLEQAELEQAGAP